MENWPQAPQAPADSNAWFNDQSAPLSVPPKKSNKRLIAILGLIITLGLLGAAVAVVGSTNQRTVCLTAEDYKTLTGTELTDAISPTTNFFADAVAFKSGSMSYDDSNSAGEQLLQKIAQLYKNQSKTSMVITIGSNYFTTDSADLAKKRANAVLESLVAMGVAASDLQAVEPTYTEPEDPSSAPQDGVTTTISIVSDQACK